jgi:hypothetical protein
MSEIKKLTSNENVIFYNNDLEQLLAQSAEECESLGILHLASYEKYNKLSNIINIPVIILSSGIGFITGIDLNYDRMNIILGIGSVFVGIIKSIDSYFQLGKRAESHRMCALQYTQINKKIQIELSLCREQRQTAKDMLSIIKTDIKNLQDISPVIDQEIIREYNLKYGKYKNVKKPNFVNGLSSVKVNSNSLEQELASVARSIPQSIQSGAPSRPMSVMGDNNYSGSDGGGAGGSFNHFINNFTDNGESNLSDLNTNVVNLNDIAVNIPFSTFQTNANMNRTSNSSNVSYHSQPNSHIRSPPALSRIQNPSQNVNVRQPAASASVSAQLVYTNPSLQTPVSSSPIPTLRIEEHQQQNNNNNNNNNTLSHLSTPRLLNAFQSQQIEQSYNEPINREINENEINLVIDIPVANFDASDNNNDNGNNNNSNQNFQNVNSEFGPESSSPTGSQNGNM